MRDCSDDRRSRSTPRRWSPRDTQHDRNDEVSVQPRLFWGGCLSVARLGPGGSFEGVSRLPPDCASPGSVCPTGITPFFRSGAVEFQRWVGVAWDIRQVISNFWTPSESQWMLTPSLSTPSTITTKITICGRPLAVRPLKFAPYAPAYVDSAESHRCGKREAT